MVIFQFLGLLLTLSLVYGPNVLAEPSHQRGPSQPSASPKVRPVETPKEPLSTEYVKGRWDDGEFQYRDEKGNWNKPLLFFRATQAGSFLNSQGAPVEYSEGDVLFKTEDFGWFKTIKETPLAQEEPPADPAVPNPKGVELTEVERAIVRLTNQERMKRGLPALVVSDSLQKLSRQKSENMAKSKNLSHGIAPRPPGGENIAWNQANAQEAVRSWMNSDGHRANILNRRYSTIGVGMAVGNGPYWTQMFQ